MLFLSNAALNNLGSPKLSSDLNIGKATIGTIPFVIIGGSIYGATGVLIGQAIGAALFGVIGLILAKKLIYGLLAKEKCQLHGTLPS